MAPKRTDALARTVSHAPLATRKAIFTRAAVLDAFFELEEQGCSSTHQAEAEAAREQILQDCAIAAAREGDDALPLDTERLDTMAIEIGEDVRIRAAKAFKSGNTKLSDILDDLADRLAVTNCDRCALRGNGSAPCGVHVDQDLVASGGECMADVRDVYDFSAALGQALYSDAWPGHGPVDQVDLRLHTHVLSPVSHTPGIARLSARTEFERDVPDDRHLSVVTLDVDGSCYGSIERDAAAYFLIHEVVSHAYYDSFATGRREHRDPYDLWSEGWMDCIAEDILRDALTGKDAILTLPKRLRANQTCRDVVGRCHAERYDTPPGRRSQDTNGMRQARRRYGAIRFRLKSISPTPAFNPMRIMHLAFAIVNANGAAHETVAAINSAASAFLFGATAMTDDLSGEERRFYTAMSAFIGHRDETRLIGDLA